MRSSDFEYLRLKERKRDHQEMNLGIRSPFTRGRALEHMVNVEQLPTAEYLPMVYSQSGGGTTGGVQIFYFVVGYSRVGGPDVVR